MKLWKWLPGRQGRCDYKKFCLWYFRIGKWGFDAYILKYQPLTDLPYHKDPIPDGKHWRLNVKLWGISVFVMEKSGVYKPVWKRFILFRPDLHYHGLTVRSTTVKLSFGFVKFN
jgi:hypothetical protein